jgi:hypothetical protein
MRMAFNTLLKLLTLKKDYMKRYKQLIYITPLFVFLSFTNVASAQQIIGFMDDVDDETPAAPIDLLIYTGLAAGAALGVKRLKK